MQQGLEIIDDIWVVEHPCGKGAMGSVFRCHNRDAPRILAAIKLLNPTLRDDVAARARFVREAEILYSLDHPHVVKVRNVRLDTERPYLEMEFVEGESLKEVIARGALGEGATVLAVQLASALAYLHRRGIYHRDLKPANILLGPDGSMRLVDFGLAVEAGEDRITEAGTTFGTVSYAPPEWIEPDRLAPAAWDLYAMGVVLYEAYTGKVAYPMPAGGGVRQQIVSIMTAKQSAAPLDPGAKAPPEIRDLIVDLTRLDPEARPRTASAVLARLGQAIPGGIPEPLSLPRILPPTLNGGPPRRRWWTKGSLVATGLAALVVILGAMIGAGVALLEPRTRDVSVLVAGVPPGTEAGLRLAGRAPTTVSGLTHEFAAIDVGTSTLEWTLGPGCAPACPGEACPPWCVTQAEAREIPAGPEPLVLALEIAPPPPRQVVVQADPAWGRVEVALGEQVAEGIGEVELGALALGPHSVEVRASGSAWAGVLELVPGDGPLRFDVPLPEPPRDEAPTPAVAEVATPAQLPAPPPAAATAGPVVTRSQFAAWLAEHPEWSRDQAVHHGRADANYLREGALEGAGYVPDVSWLAAVAYCADRGGLALLEAGPHSWEEGAAQPFHEWRQHGGNPSWRRFDGETSDAARRTETNAFTGFRCTR